MLLRSFAFILCFTLFFFGALAQEEESKESVGTLFEVDYSTPLTIDLDVEEDTVVAPKEKKKKKKVFYDIKTRKGFTRNGFGKDVVIELFYFPKEVYDPDPYVRDIYWYDFRKKKIIKSRNPDRKYAVLLHGPYQKLLGDQILEEGIFYLGTKHGRWTRFNRHDILQDKQKYYKGWPKESKVAYYDKDKEKLKEVIPVAYGEMDGYYYAFHESGRVAAVGEYQFDHKVGIWREYYDRRNRRKREIQYPEDPFDEEYIPYILKEWDKSGKLIYDRDKLNKQLGG